MLARTSARERSGFEPLRGRRVVFFAFLATLPFLLSADTRETRSLYWVIAGPTVSRIKANHSSLADYHFNNARAFVLGNEDDIQNAAVSGYSSIPTLKYESYARFHSDIRSRRIDRSIRTVMYDPELWPATPYREKRDPKRYMRQFANLAHVHGYIVINGPSRDLVNARFAYCRRRSGETLSRAYLRCRIPAEGARYADVFTIQAQVHENDASRYRRFVRAARDQARMANPHVVVLSNLATSPHGFVATPRMLWRAHRAVEDIVEGHALTVNAHEYRIAEEFLRMLQAAEE